MFSDRIVLDHRFFRFYKQFFAFHEEDADECLEEVYEFLQLIWLVLFALDLCLYFLLIDERFQNIQGVVEIYRAWEPEIVGFVSLFRIEETDVVVFVKFFVLCHAREKSVMCRQDNWVFALVSRILDIIIDSIVVLSVEIQYTQSSLEMRKIFDDK